jgi:glycosyltransferase involved in cell wall biosynthesis
MNKARLEPCRAEHAARESRASNPTVSVTITNYNYGRFLNQAIESVRAQSFDDFELILVDNASSDDSLDIMRRHAADDSRIRLIEHPRDIGRFASLRESLDLARGRYRVHVDADDFVLDRDAFKTQVELLDQHAEMAFVFSSLTLVNSEGRILYVSHPYRYDVVLPSEEALEKILTFNLNHSGMMFRLKYYRETQGYAEHYPQLCDIMLAVNLSEKGSLVGYIDKPLYAFRQHGGNLNLHPDMKIVKKEVLPVIAASFDGPLGSRLANPSHVRRRVERTDLVHLPTQHIFSDQPTIGWRLYWESARLRPYDTIFQRRTLSLVARTLLGGKAYWRVAQPFLNRR